MKALFASLIVLVCSVNLLFAQKKFTVGKEPSWVSRQTIDYAKSNLNKDAEGGSIDYDYENQVSLADKSVYVRRSYKVLSESGVQDNSQVTIEYDPSFQQLVIHNIQIIRDGQIINKLQPANIKTIQQETDLNRYIYNGTLQEVLFLEDVRKNDIIEYSYTLKGFNPIFQNKYSDFYNTKFSAPYYSIYYKLIVPSGRTMNIKNSKETIQPLVKTEAGQITYEWKLNDVEPLHLQDGYPGWLDPYPCVMISEFQSWSEVSKWASTLFPKTNTISGELKKKIEQIKTQYPTSEGRTTAALRFVQDDIRYMGLEMGIHSHLPVSPEKVMSRRFGDCKEKSYLLVTMLQNMGIEAAPVLINTDYTQAINNWLPSSNCFDHATVRVKLDDGCHWFDPTISYQRGTLADISYPDYKTGLIVSDTSTALTTIGNHEKGGEKVKEIFTVPDMTGKAKLKVITTYAGSNADNVREDFNSNSVYEIQKGYQQFYQSYYSKLTADSLAFSDDENGSFTTTEYYSIDSFWNIDKSKLEQSFEPYIINSILKKPKEKNRNLPFSITFPAKYHEEIEILLPDNWNLKPFHADVKNAAFTFKADCIVYDRRISIEYDYEALKDYVTSAEASDYFIKLNQLREHEAYSLTINDDKNNSDAIAALDKHDSNPMYLAVPVLLFVGIAVWLSQRKQS